MKFILFTTILVLIISTATFGVLYYKERNKYDLFEIESNMEKNHLKATKESLKGAFLESQKYNNVKIILPYSEKSNDFTLYLFISKNHCIRCVNETLEYFVSSNKNIADSNFVVLADFNPNSIKQLKVEHQLRCKIVSVFDKNVVIAKNKYPCYFIYNKETSETDMFLFPLKNEPEMMNTYFENVNSKYFAQNKNIYHDK